MQIHVKHKRCEQWWKAEPSSVTSNLCRLAPAPIFPFDLYLNLSLQFRSCFYREILKCHQNLPPDQGLCLCIPLGAPPQTPAIGSRSALAMYTTALPPLNTTFTTGCECACSGTSAQMLTSKNETLKRIRVWSQCYYIFITCANKHTCI